MLTGDKNEAVVPYRNHFAAGTGSPDMITLDSMTAKGWVRMGAPLSWGCFYHVTEAGAAAVGLKLPKD